MVCVCKVKSQPLGNKLAQSPNSPGSAAAMSIVLCCRLCLLQEYLIQQRADVEYKQGLTKSRPDLFNVRSQHDDRHTLCQLALSYLHYSGYAALGYGTHRGTHVRPWWLQDATQVSSWHVCDPCSWQTTTNASAISQGYFLNHVKYLNQHVCRYVGCNPRLTPDPSPCS